MNIKKFMDEKPLLSFGIVAAAIVLFGFIYFLFSKDNALNPNSITGWQALAQEKASFWGWGIFLTIVVCVISFFAVKHFSNDDSTKFGTLWIVIGVFLAVAWGKGCTNKADDGVSSTKGRPVPVQVDSTRESAEDQLKRQK